jgi:hypothetical protein
VRVTRDAAGIELYFPPLRLPAVALQLGAFGLVSTALAGLALAVLLPPSLEDTAALMAAVLLAIFLGPFAAFGLALFGIALYMGANALRVCIRSGWIETERTLLGAVVGRRRMRTADVASVEAWITARHQSVFSSEPVYQLVAVDRVRRRRVVVAESLKGDAIMDAVKALIETAAGHSAQDPGVRGS